MSRRQILVLMTALMTGVLLSALDRTVVATAMPTIVGRIGGLDQYSWVITAYLLTSTAFMPLYGKISDLHGRRPVMFFAIITFLVGSMLAGLSMQMWQLIASRAVQGLGAGGLMTMAFTIIGDHVSPRERAKYQGFFAVTFGVSSLAGPVVGGYLADHDWRWIFFLNIPLGIVSLVTLGRLLKVPNVRRQHSVDYLGALLLVAGVSLLLLVLSWGGKEYAWRSGTIIGLTAGGLLLSALFLLWQARAGEPIVPLSLFRDRNYALATVGGFVLGVVMFGAVLFLPVYLQVVQGRTATRSGVLMLPVLVTLNVTSFVAGRLISRLGRYKPLMVFGAVAMTAGLFGCARLRADTSLVEVVVSMLLLGIGQGLLMQPLILAVQNGLPRARLGAGTATETFLRSLGGSFGIAVFGAVLTNRLGRWLPDGGVDRHELLGEPKRILALPVPVRVAIQAAFEHSLHTVFLTAAGISAVAVVATALMPDVRLRGPAAAQQVPPPVPRRPVQVGGSSAAVSSAESAAASSYRRSMPSLR